MLREALLTQVQMNAMAAGKNLDGVTHAESLVVPRPAGNPINWVFGHLIDSRTAMFALLGERPVWNERERTLYGLLSDPHRPGWQPLPLDELRAVHASTQERLTRAIEGASNEQLARVVPKLFDPKSSESTAVQLAFLTFHESYHVGQLGLLRRLVGKPTAIGAPRR